MTMRLVSAVFVFFVFVSSGESVDTLCSPPPKSLPQKQTISKLRKVITEELADDDAQGGVKQFSPFDLSGESYSAQNTSK